MPILVGINQLPSDFAQRIVPGVFAAFLSILILGFSTQAFAISEVNLTLDDGSAAEALQNPGSFTVTRTNDGNIAQAITVWVAVSGSATIDTDYAHPDMVCCGPGNEYLITILSNQLSRTITITPELDNIVEGPETFTVTLLDIGTTYTVGADIEASIQITDDVTEVILTLDDGDAAEAGQLPGSFTVTRTNQGNVAQAITVWVAVSGSATIDTDYAHPDMVCCGPGNEYLITILGNQLSRTITITPVLDAFEDEGDETVVVTLLDIGQIYTVGVQLSATITIRDFQNLLFKNGFEDQAQ